MHGWALGCGLSWRGGAIAPDVVFARGEGVGKPDGHLMCWYFTRTADNLQPLAQELERRGYDLSTMVFSIMKRSTSDAAAAPK